MEMKSGDSCSWWLGDAMEAPAQTFCSDLSLAYHSEPPQAFYITHGQSEDWVAGATVLGTALQSRTISSLSFQSPRV